MHHMHAYVRRPTLAIQLKEFISASKHLLRTTPRPSAIHHISTYIGRDLLLARYGIFLHMPAVPGELCVAPHVCKAMHDMLLTIRATKHSSGEDKLKASAKPLPKLEPWLIFVGKPPPHPSPIGQH